MNRFDCQGWKQDDAIRSRHPGERAQDSRQPPSLRNRSQNRAQDERQKQAFRVPNMQVISGRKDEEKPNRRLRGPCVVVELDDSSQQNCSGDRSKTGNNKGADKIVVAGNKGDHACAPREKRVKPRFHHASRVVTELGHLQIVKRIPAVPNLQPTGPARKRFIFQNTETFAPKTKSKILIDSTQATTIQSSVSKKRCHPFRSGFTGSAAAGTSGFSSLILSFSGA